MKRSLAWILILVLVAAMSVTAFATEATEIGSGNSQEVRATYEEGRQDKTVISVDISWEQMTFTYTGESAPVWDAEEHRYKGERTEAGWSSQNGTITIKNNSNTILQAEIEYTPETAYDTVDMSFTANAPYIGSAYTDDRTDSEGNVCGTPCQITVKAIPTGILPEDTGDNTRIGTITITLNQEVDAELMLEELEESAANFIGQDVSKLKRGDVFLNTETDLTALLDLITAAKDMQADRNATEQAKNVAINEALVAYYGALEMAQ